MHDDNPALASRGPVLIVEDDRAVLNSLKFSLEVEGFSVRAHPSSASLLATTDWQGPGCLVIDYNLPHGNGLDVLHQLRARGVAAPAILMTSNADPLLRRRAAAAGAPIVEKPLLGGALTEAIRQALDARGGKRRRQ